MSKRPSRAARPVFSANERFLVQEVMRLIETGTKLTSLARSGSIDSPIKVTSCPKAVSRRDRLTQYALGPADLERVTPFYQGNSHRDPRFVWPRVRRGLLWDKFLRGDCPPSGPGKLGDDGLKDPFGRQFPHAAVMFEGTAAELAGPAIDRNLQMDGVRVDVSLQAGWVGPKSVTTGTPNGRAKCRGPESVVTSSSARSIGRLGQADAGRKIGEAHDAFAAPPGERSAAPLPARRVRTGRAPCRPIGRRSGGPIRRSFRRASASTRRKRLPD